MENDRLCKKILDRSNNPKDSSSVTIAFLGDSVTWGCFETFQTGENTLDTVYEPQSSYVSLFKKSIETLFPRAQINIINSGISGDNAEGGFSRLQRDVLKFEPDLTVVCFGLNDCTGGLSYLKTYVENLKNIFSAIKEKKLGCIFMTPNMMNTYVSPIICGDFLRNIAQHTKQLQTDGTFDEFLSEAKRAALAFDVSVCDCYEKWKAMFKNGVDTTSLLCNGINHPSREMHKLFSEALIEKLFY